MILYLSILQDWSLFCKLSAMTSKRYTLLTHSYVPTM